MNMCILGAAWGADVCLLFAFALLTHALPGAVQEAVVQAKITSKSDYKWHDIFLALLLVDNAKVLHEQSTGMNLQPHS